MGERNEHINARLSFSDEVGAEGCFSLPPALAERFHLTGLLAENEHNKTYLLAEKDGGKEYVLKVYRKASIARDSSEAELLRGLDHPGLPKLEQDYDDGETLYVLREYVEGETLTKLIKYGLDTEQAVRIALKLCDLLTYLHTSLIIHRDVTPSNIIVERRSGTVHLIDFGIARRYSKDALKDTVYLGKNDYAPPEQGGYKQTDARSDVYSLGVVLRQMLTGGTGKPVPDKGLAKIAEKCTAFEMYNRYPTAAALKRALLRHTRRAKRRKVSLLAAAVAASLTLCAGLAAGYYFTGHHMGLFSPGISSDPNEIYTFKEPLIEQAARLMLGRNDSEPLTLGELAEVRGLYIVGDQVVPDGGDWFWHHENAQVGSIASLEDLRVFKRLQSFNIQRQPFSDLTPLTECTQLRQFIVESCDVEDLSPLAELPLLNQLNLNDCFVTDYSIIRNIQNLTNLYLGMDNNIHNMAELGYIPTIDRLSIISPQFENLYGIELMAKLEFLDIRYTSVQDFSPLNELPYLNTLQISPNMEQYLDTLDNDNVEVVFG